MREMLSWTWADFRALPRLWRLSLGRRLAGFLLDHLGKDIETELAYRHFAKRARQSGADFYCPVHDCDAQKCPAGAHG